MFKTALARTENFIRADLPAAVAEIKHFQLQNDRISFELQFYADAEAKTMITNPTPGTTPAMMPGAGIENGGIVARKHFSESVAVIEGYEPEENATTLTGKLISCCYQWLIDKHYPAATEI